jgi:hypothetical protein
MTMIDINCWERGCACYDSRIADETVEVVRREWVGLTDEQFAEACRFAENGNYLVAFQRIQHWIKEKNT